MTENKAKVKKLSEREIGDLVDKLGKLRKDQTDLAIEDAEITATLKGVGIMKFDSPFSGSEYEATLSKSSKTSLIPDKVFKILDIGGRIVKILVEAGITTAKAGAVHTSIMKVLNPFTNMSSITKKLAEQHLTKKQITQCEGKAIIGKTLRIKKL